MPKVSVIIPTYNSAAFISAAVDSVLAQTFTDYEIIVLDDGSTDNTAQALAVYSAVPQFRYIPQENQGTAAARNAGARASEAEYLAFLDHDDALDPKALEVMVREMDRTGAAWCIVDILRIRGERKEIRRTTWPEGNYFYAILKDDFIKRSMFFRRREFIDAGMYDVAMAPRQEWDFNIRMIKSGKPFVHVNEALYWHYWRDGSQVTNRPKILAYGEKILRAHHKRLADAGDRRAAQLYAENMWDLARHYFYELRDYSKMLACMRESLAYNPSLRRLLHPIVHKLRRLETA